METVYPMSSAFERTRFSTWRGPPSNGSPSVVTMSQMIRAAAEPSVLAVAAPREHRERVGVGDEPHVRLLNSHEPLDGGAVEVDPR